MPSCVSTFPFAFHHLTTKNYRQRNPDTVSKPTVRFPSAAITNTMHRRGSSFTISHTQGETHAGSSSFFLAPNKNGIGKTAARRQGLPTSPLPTNNDTTFVGATLTSSHTQMASGADDKRPKLAIRTTMPLTEHNDSSTIRQTTPKPRFDPVKAFRNSFRSRLLENDDPGNTSENKRWKGKERADFEPVDELRESKVAAKAREIREWMKGKSGSEIHRSVGYYSSHRSKQGNGEASRNISANTRQTMGGGVRDLFKNKGRLAREPRDRGPKAGQTYEIVNRRIIENNPDRTVEISTWRREPDTPKVPKPKDEDDKMSIYYISADEYPVEGEFASEASPQVEWRAEDVQEISMTPSNRRNGTTKIRKQEEGKSHSRRYRSEVTSPLSVSREGTISPSASEKDLKTSQQPARGIQQNGRAFADRGMPGSSTPKANGNMTMNQSTRSNTRPHRDRYKEKELPQCPFHPTESGSTISSIKSEGTVEFESILESCEPSLLHTAPILRSLGIRRVEHMRAVARLTPSTRDREVKEDALRLGITVMEWAIFVDRILSV
ncbi:hypothetical protein JR316_0007303 [Psilocybe cubensis]|uniref:Uncharacterized protein n=2 Tax=Psilocybe cubensis TaxID=181762 RepID=A0ACB8GYU7_PSICU|nr:hypothetical protein JR316_0007303 [Psilocybe cubensis]KAH9480703.1 hypothetical protein JR316_0007303 [Psilocybe cubensis]